MPELETEEDIDPAWSDVSAADAQKRFTEFVGKRSPYEFLGKRGYEFLGKRGPYEFLGKRGPYEFLGKRGPYEFLGKRSPYEFLGKRSPYEFLGKRSPYEFLGKRPMSKKRYYDFLGKRVQLPYEFVGKRIFQELASGEQAADNSQAEAGSGQSGNVAGRFKRYSEWIGKRNSRLSEELLRQLVDKRLNSLMRNRVAGGGRPEFIGRRELIGDPETSKRYAEFIGKK
nr:hypothetical protein BaRGS_021556 [Batillaria attramentaria]